MLDAHIAIATQALSVQRGERLLIRDLSFQLAKSQAVHLTGTNGSGKTSLLRVLAGLSPAHEGRVLYGDGTRLIFLGHALGLKPELSVTENLKFLLEVADLKEQMAIDEALEQVGLARYFDIPVGSLSAGQKKRVGLARLLLEPSTLWLLDEPFSALDTKSCQWLCAQIDRYVLNGGAVLLTSHQPVVTAKPLPVLDVGGR